MIFVSRLFIAGSLLILSACQNMQDSTTSQITPSLSNHQNRQWHQPTNSTYQSGYQQPGARPGNQPENLFY